MYLKFLLTISVFFITLVISHPADAQRASTDLQVTIPVRFVTVQGEFFERIGVDFDFPGTTEVLRTDPGFGAAIGGGLLFPDAIGNSDVMVGARVLGSRFGADNITNQFGNTFPASGSVTDIGVGLDLAVLINILDRQATSRAVSRNRVDLKLSAGGGVVSRHVDIEVGGVPLVDSSRPAIFGEIGAGLQIPLNNIGNPGQTSLFLGVNHRVTEGIDLNTIPGIPFRFRSTSTTSARMELIIFIKPRLVPENEQEN